MESLTKEDIIEINKKVGEKGTVINDANLEFAIHKLGRNTVLGKKAAILLCDLITSHVFLDGNKRTAFVSTVALLEINGKKLKIKDGDALDLVYGIANGKYNIPEAEHILGKWIE
jgi:death-on-curing protein